MSMWTDLFGRDSSFMTAGLGTQPRVNTGSLEAMTPEQRQKYNELLNQMSQPGAKYTGQLTADQNALQGQSLSAMEQAAMNAVAPGNATEQSSKALTDIMNAKPTDLTDYFKTTIQDPAMQMFKQQVMPELTRRFSGNAGYGSDRMIQEGQAAGNTMTGVASAMGAASQKALEEQQRNKIAAAMGLPSIGAANIDQLLKLQQGGANARMQDQQQLSAQYNEFQRQQAAEEERRKAMIEALKTKSKDNYAVATGGTSGGVSNFLGGFGQGLGSFLGGRGSSA